MQRRHRHRGVRRLLILASAAFVLAAAFADAAQAGLAALTGQSDTVTTTLGTVTSTVDGATTAIAAPVDSTTGATDPAGAVVDSTESTVNDTVASTAQTVSATTEAVTRTVDQTLATTDDTVNMVASGPQSTLDAATRQTAAASITPSESAMPAPSPQTAPSTADAPNSQTVTSSSDRVVMVIRRVGEGTIAPPAGAAAAQGPGTSAVPQGQMPTSRTRTAPASGKPVALRRSPRPDLPRLLFSLAALSGGAGGGNALVLVALLGTVLLAGFGRRGRGVFPDSDLFRTPDVLFQLERPG
jgi:hypothetical protein